MHDDVRGFVAECITKFGPFPYVLEVGSRDINGGVRDLFPREAHFTGIDLYAGPGVDLVADFARLDARRELPIACTCHDEREHGCRLSKAGAVVCLEVLEHAENAPQIVAKAFDILQAGGVLIMTCAGPNRAPHSALDENPIRPDEFYRNVTPQLFDQWLTEAGFTDPNESEIRLVRDHQDLQAWARKP